MLTADEARKITCTSSIMNKIEEVVRCAAEKGYTVVYVPVPQEDFSFIGKALTGYGYFVSCREEDGLVNGKLTMMIDWR